MLKCNTQSVKAVTLGMIRRRCLTLCYALQNSDPFPKDQKEIAKDLWDQRIRAYLNPKGIGVDSEA